MLHVACCLWDANEHSAQFSLCYNETWVEKLYRGFKRNLTRPFRFVCFTDRERKFCDGVYQEPLATKVPDYGCLIEPFKLNEPSIICGLDTMVLRNVDHMADYCMTARNIALPRHPSRPEVTINPVVFVPAGHRRIYDEWRGENDMQWLAKQSPDLTDKIWPGQILSLKLHDVRRRGTQGAHIIYFHGPHKPHQLQGHGWVQQHWV